MTADFKPGDRVEFCGEQATVVKNFGRDGIVEMNGERMRWYWEFQGERVTLVCPHERLNEDGIG